MESENRTCRVKTMCENSIGRWYVCRCGASVNPGDGFCRMCGAKLVWEVERGQDNGRPER